MAGLLGGNSQAMQACGTEQVAYQPPTLREQLAQKRQAYQERLAIIDGAIEALDANPTLEQFQDVIQQAQYL